MVTGAVVPAHRLHDVKKHRGSQIRAEVNEHGKNHHSEAESLLIIFFQNSCTVPAPETSHGNTPG